MSGLRPRDRVLPDLHVVGQCLDVFGGFLLVLAMLEQCRTGRPEHGRALAIGELRQGTEMQRLGIVPILRHAKRRIEVLGVVTDPLSGESNLVGGAIDAAVGRTGE